jgi:hypothetical protein
LLQLLLAAVREPRVSSLRRSVLSATILAVADCKKERKENEKEFFFFFFFRFLFSLRQKKNSSASGRDSRANTEEKGRQLIQQVCHILFKYIMSLTHFTVCLHSWLTAQPH